jgi:hypothetical protein
MSPAPKVTPDKLSTQQEIAITGFMAGKMVKDIAEMAGVTRKTIIAWVGEPNFRRKLVRQINALHLTALTSMADLLSVATARIKEIIENPETKPNDVISATRLLISSIEYLQTTDLEQRVLEIEQAVGITQIQENSNGRIQN